MYTYIYKYTYIEKEICDFTFPDFPEWGVRKVRKVRKALGALLETLGTLGGSLGGPWGGPGAPLEIQKHLKITIIWDPFCIL